MNNLYLFNKIKNRTNSFKSFENYFKNLENSTNNKSNYLVKSGENYVNDFFTPFSLKEWKKDNQVVANECTFPKPKLNLIENNKSELDVVLDKPEVDSIHHSGSTREWYDSIYSFNKNYIKNLADKDNIVKNLFKSYFNMKFLSKKDKSKLKLKRIKALRFSNNRFILSKSEIRHTNSKVIFTLFIFNNTNRAILNYLKNLYSNNILRFLPENLVLEVLKWKKYRRLSKLRQKKLNSLKLENNNTKFKQNIIKKFNIYGYSIFNNDKNYIVDKKIDNNKVMPIHSIQKIKKVLKRVKKLKMIKIFFYSTLKSLVKLYILNENKISLLVGKFDKTFNSNKYKIKLLKRIIKDEYYLLDKKWLKVRVYKLNLQNKRIIWKRKHIVMALKKRYHYVTVKNLKIKISKLTSYLYYNQLIMFNKFKFTYLFLNYKGFGLINILSRIYNKKIEFNLVNLKSVHLNSDVLTQSMAVKLSNRKNKLLVILRKALNMTKLPKLFLYINHEAADESKKVNILNSIKYKNISGVRFEASGRLTRRLIAARSVFKLRYKGTVKNIYSSYKGIPSVLLRGYLKSSLQYSLINSKTQNGAFGLKGWINSY